VLQTPGMRTRSAIAPWLIVATALLTALAYASPPDPVWVAGIFDAADTDQAVEFLASATALVESLPFYWAPAVPVIAERLLAPRDALPDSPSAAPGPVRGPPSP